MLCLDLPQSDSWIFGIFSEPSHTAAQDHERMKARELMTREVVSARADMPTTQVAQVLLEKRISAVPVVDEGGTPIGMVSEGDLLGREDTDRDARRDWWLALLAEGMALGEEFLASLRAPERTVRSVMSGPVVCVGEDTDAAEIAQLLAAYRIKRVPVVRDGRIVGIVSRADLLRALSTRPAATPKPGFLASAFASLDHRFSPPPRRDEPREAATHSEPDEIGLTAADFQHLTADFQHREYDHRAEMQRADAERRRRKMAELIDHHISDESWRSLWHQARRAAEHGQSEFMLLRFPNQLCSDHGRAINMMEPGWPATLWGEAAEIYLRWEQDLKPRGFHLAARVLDFPGGMPGDIGLFLIWG
jgi:CBS domain-containing protein